MSEDRGALAFLGLVVPGGMLLNVLLKNAFARSRPDFVDSALTFNGYGFPSGHTMAATLLYGALTVIVGREIVHWRWRVLMVLGAVLLVLLVALSRLYFGAHYLSDVLAAAAAGVTWLALCWTALETLRQRRRRDASAPHG